MFTLITPPATEPISLSDFKSALRVEHSDDDAIITQMALTARTFVERRLDLALLPQPWSLTLDHIPSGLINLRPSRVANITSVTAQYGAEPAVALANDQWCLFKRQPAQVAIDAPSVQGGEALTELTIVFDAGFTSPSDIPADLLRALYMLTAHYYEEREVFRAQRYVPVPYGVETILAAFKEVRL